MKTSIRIFIILTMILLTSSVSFAGGGSGKGGGRNEPEPEYYSLEDLRMALSWQRFYFSNENKPVEALVDLGYYPICAASMDKKYSVVSMVSTDPMQYGVNSFNICASWNDNQVITFNWLTFELNGGMRCDLVFSRGNGIAAEIVKRFSNWTHVAIVENVSNKTVFESTPATGVSVNKTTDTWKDITYYTCKRIKRANNPQGPVSYFDLEGDLQCAINYYKGKPYFPRVSTATDIIGGFLLKWSDKNNMESMYCSKLVHKTFLPHVNLDGNRTKVDNFTLKDGTIAGPVFSWIGVSPDDIYFSDALDYDFAYSSNVLYL